MPKSIRLRGRDHVRLKARFVPTENPICAPTRHRERAYFSGKRLLPDRKHRVEINPWAWFNKVTFDAFRRPSLIHRKDAHPKNPHTLRHQLTAHNSASSATGITTAIGTAPTPGSVTPLETESPPAGTQSLEGGTQFGK